MAVRVKLICQGLRAAPVGVGTFPVLAIIRLCIPSIWQHAWYLVHT